MRQENGYFFIPGVQILAAEGGGQIPAAALTAYAIAQKQERAIEAGFQTHIVEPIEPIQLGLYQIR